MVTLLAKLFIHDRENYGDSKVRTAYGTLCSIVGILLNVLMSAGKLIAGKLTGSISMVADALNNISDAGSGIITFVGFKTSEKAADDDHPFGHGRIEYVSGFVVSLLVLLMGFELLKESITKIIHPEPITANVAAYVILIASIMIKLYMAFYNSRIGKKLNSTAMKAVAVDSLSDTLSTSVVIAATLISQFAHVNVDAYGGLIVSLVILYAGISSAKETISPLLGQKPDEELVEKVVSIVKHQPDVVGIHDMIIHDYGPGRLYISLHAEVPGEKNVFDLHEEIDDAEAELRKTLSCEAVIHMDPVETENEAVTEMKERVYKAVVSVNPEYTIHDFRMVPGKGHTNLLFDCVVAPTEHDLEGVKKRVTEAVEAACLNCFAIITVEHSYV